MHKYLNRKNLFLNLMTFFSFLIFIFFVSHIFLGERSLWKIFLLNNQISIAKEKYNILLSEKAKTLSEINLLRDNNLDPDIVSEIAHKLLGIIHSNKILINNTK
mgnify:CR=1 FL=1